MAKRRREPDSDGTAIAMAEFNTVFIDTSLDTHLAMLVSSSDTVSDFKSIYTISNVIILALLHINVAYVHMNAQILIL